MLVSECSFHPQDATSRLPQGLFCISLAWRLERILCLAVNAMPNLTAVDMGSFILSSSAPSPLAVDVPAVSTLCVSESDMTSAALPRCVWICLNGLFSSTSLCAGSLERNAPWTQTLKHAMFMRRSRLCCVIEIAVKTPTHPVEGIAVRLSHPLPTSVLHVRSTFHLHL